MKKTVFITIVLLSILFLAKTASAATLSLSPDSGSYSAGQIFTVDIILDTQGQPIDGVDIYLNYNPGQLEVQDDDNSQTETQITPGNLMPLTQANSVDSAAGKITFSQITTGGNIFKSNGAQILATIHFKVLKSESSAVSFDFKPQDTHDSNVASKGVDILTAVTNAIYGSTSVVETISRGDMTTALIIFIILIVIIALIILLRRMVLKSLKKDQV